MAEKNAEKTDNLRSIDRLFPEESYAFQQVSVLVSLAFSNENEKSFLGEYLKAIQQNLTDVQVQLRRFLGLILLLVVFFELITRATISEVTLGPFKVGDLSLIQRGLPVAIAYCYLEIWWSLIRRNRLGWIQRSIMKHFYKPIYDAGLHRDLEPLGPTIFAFRLIPKSQERMVKIISTISISLLIDLYLIFQVYAFFRLFVIFGSKSLLTWLSLVLSLVVHLWAFMLSPRQRRKHQG
jgi:hypothetical protein